ncbi:hypothetical protein HPB50_022466 [Hyalomma asiaticum]|uniref:Uncharacterized protein n=1 Tax=Hyalomma asiaticum TaxID=266040 RepID=A0ACB7TLT6_HYAAI|nr:hypothetical protein HPB50_022466 [Hyalomma asiaticum]
MFMPCERNKGHDMKKLAHGMPSDDDSTAAEGAEDGRRDGGPDSAGLLRGGWCGTTSAHRKADHSEGPPATGHPRVSSCTIKRQHVCPAQESAGSRTPRGAGSPRPPKNTGLG